MRERSGSANPCDAHRVHLVELSIGILDGRRRELTLRHVHSCGPCSAELAALSALGDDLMKLVPSLEPPRGFEQRLTERLNEAPTLPPLRRRFRVGDGRPPR